MNNSGVNTVLLVIVIIILVAGGVWWYSTHASSSQSAPQNGLQVNVSGNTQPQQQGY